jgi:serine/tyrosine/threonine adenylyltransferase
VQPYENSRAAALPLIKSVNAIRYIDTGDLDYFRTRVDNDMLAATEAACVFPFDNSYARLPERFFARLPPTPVAAPRLVRLNHELARKLGLDAARLSAPEGVAILAGNALAKLGEPLAMAYAGHQFGSFVPQLGDGRALLLGEIVDLDGARRDIQLKGSGPTPFSRNGDGRAALGPVLREYIISEAMDALGIPTTRSLAVVTTGQPVRREVPLPGAVLTRVASSHIRIGTFQFFAARGDIEAVRQLADYVIARHYPEVARTAQPYRLLLESVIARQAELIAKWLLVGFIHGVMNTDNMSIAGETIDYGPCAFIDSYDPEAVYSSIDSFGRYAYGNQPRIAQWNLARLAETLLPLLAENQEAAVAMANEVVSDFTTRFEAAYAAGLRRKLGLFQEQADDITLARDLLDRMARNGADFTLSFRRLSDAAVSLEADTVVRSLFSDPTAYDEWALKWRRRLTGDGEVTGERRAAAMRAVNPAFIPRNHLVEAALSVAVNDGDFSAFDKLLTVLSRPYEDQPAHRLYAEPPRPEQVVRQTFCGT